MAYSGVAGIFIALCIAVVLALKGERLRKERPGLIILAVFSLWGLVAPMINDLLFQSYPDYSFSFTAGMSGLLLAVVASVRMHSLNQWRFGILFWPTAILALVVGLGVFIFAFDGRYAETNHKIGMYTLMLVCAIQALVVVIRVSKHADARE